MSRIVIWGAGSHAGVVAEAIALAGTYELVGFLDDVNPQRGGMKFCQSYVLGGKEQLKFLLDNGTRHLALGVGDCSARLRMAEVARASGFKLVTVIHPSALISPSATIAAGCMVGPRAVINPGSSIAEAAIINSGSVVEHGCQIGAGVHICPGVLLAGDVVVGRGAWVGIGAVVIEKISIGDWAFVGAGAVVVRNVAARTKVAGVPARVIGSHECYA